MESSGNIFNRAALALLGLLLAGLILAGWLGRGTHAAPGLLALVLGLAVASTLVSLGRALQLQNVFTVAGIISIVSGIVLTVGIATGIPFGPIIFTENCGGLLFDTLPWAAPLLWVVILLNCRGVARLILRPWRKLHGYGYRVMGLTCLLVALFDVGLEPFATRVQRFWIWRVSGGGKCLEWFAAPWVNFLGWALAALLILMVATPWLINKMPSRRRTADFHPLIAWAALNVFLVAMLALHQLWLPAGITLAVAVAGTISAWRNAA